jgi:hypothetical protein
LGAFCRDALLLATPRSRQRQHGHHIDLVNRLLVGQRATWIMVEAGMRAGSKYLSRISRIMRKCACRSMK